MNPLYAGLRQVANKILFGSVIDVAQNKKNLNSSVVPIQIQRIKQDTLTWREGAEEMERPYFPFRVKVQQLYIDTILNPHVAACVERRKDLTLLRDWHITTGKKNSEGVKVTDEKTTTLLNEIWFNSFMSHSLDALFFGYTLVSLGDVVNGKFVDLQTVKRWNISPDRFVVASVPYNTDGVNFLTDEEAKKWHVWVPTPNDIGTSPCGYGLLYKVGVLEIFLRNILGYNGDFVELYSQPYRIGKTSKTDKDERDEFEAAVANMGSAGYMITDDIGDTVEFLETALGGTGWQGYDNFEQRLEKKISKLILGHADALDSTPGKLGGEQGEESPAGTALKDKQTKDGVFIADIVNSELLPRLRALGFPIAEGLKFEFKNDAEINANNDKLTDTAVKMSQAGLQIDPEYYEKQTGIKVKIPEAAPAVEPVKEHETEKKESIKNKLERLYM